MFDELMVFPIALYMFYRYIVFIMYFMSLYAATCCVVLPSGVVNNYNL